MKSQSVLKSEDIWHPQKQTRGKGYVANVE